MIDRIYIIRHGFRMNWVTDSWKSVTGLPRDPPLAAFGETQAQEVARYFQSLTVEERPTAIISSPYYRCIQTSQPIAQTLGLPILIEHGISEWYSPIVPGTGLHPRPASATSLQEFFPEIDNSWTSLWYPSRKGETLNEVHERTAGFLEVFIPEVKRRMPANHSRILLVSHAAVVITLVRELTGDRELAFRVGCCTLSDLKRKSDTEEVLGSWTVNALATGDHLHDGILRDWGFDHIVLSNGKVIEDPGLPVEGEEEGPVGCQLQRSNL